MYTIKISFVIISLLFSIINNFTIAQEVLSFNSSYKYLKGSEAADIDIIWNNTGFDDSGWETGNAPFWYGDGTGGTVLSDMQSNYSTLYLRKKIYLDNPDSIGEIEIKTDFDDGFIIWINGEVIAISNAPEYPSPISFATGNHESGTVEIMDAYLEDVVFLQGENMVAIQCFNVSLSSSDFHFDLSLRIKPKRPRIPDSLQVIFDYPSGYYSSPFDLTLTSPDTNFSILYTVDGSKPDTLDSFKAVKEKILRIDPDSTTGGRGTTPAFLVKAALYKDGYLPGNSVSRTFIFLDKVKTQSFPGGEWPSGSVNGQNIDYDMDQEVINDPRYSSLIDAALLDLPVISISTDMDNMFDPGSGIYVNPYNRGRAAERECNIELFYSDTTKGFNINAGIRIRGGASRNTGNPKHSFRLFFRKEYGTKKLNYPLFEEEGADKYDKIDLRTAQNYSWSGDGGENHHNTFIRDIFSRDSQRDLNRPYARGRYYHLYLNGMYWGLFQTQERTEARFASSYFGDDVEDYDVVKVSPSSWPYFVEVTDGNDNAWREIYDLCESNQSRTFVYNKLQGKDIDGNPEMNSKILIDFDNLIDYMMIIFYTGNFDAPVSTFGENKMPNNFYAIYNRKDKSKGFIFCAHDSEHSLMIDPVYVGEGLYEDRVNLIDHPDESLRMEVNYFEDFHPQWLHYKMRSSIDYQVRFADRAYALLSPNNLFSPEIVKERLTSRIKEIDTAIIAESARWGDSKNHPVRTKDDHWLPEINSILYEFAPFRTNIVINQLKSVSLYPGIDQPTITVADTLFNVNDYLLNDQITFNISYPNASGNICYTLDGTDPRKMGGDISERAISFNVSKKVTISSSAILKIRVKDDNDWSALREIRIYKINEDYSNFKITELHYHPSDLIINEDTIDNKKLEFIEFKNIGDQAINISGIKLDSAVQYTVPQNTILPPLGFYVLASKPQYFYERYGLIPSGNYQGQFSNNGENVLVSDPYGNELIYFTYSDASPWPVEADGDGYSLVSVEPNPTNDPENFDYWRNSLNEHGSPFSDDIITSLLLTEFKPEFQLYPNPTSSLLYITLNDNIHYEKIEILSCDGILLYSEEIRTNEIIVDFNSLNINKGLYLVKVIANDVALVKKIVYSP